MSKLDDIIKEVSEAGYIRGDNQWSDDMSKLITDEQAKQQIKDLFLELADELTDDISGLGRDIINTDELKQRINEL